MAQEAQNIEDADLKAGFAALAVLKGEESSAQKEWQEHEDLKAAEAKKAQKRSGRDSRKSWSSTGFRAAITERENKDLLSSTKQSL